MSTRTKIFSYKGFLAAETDLDDGVFLNDPKAGGQLGVVIPSTEVDITTEAKELLENAKREGGSFAPIMLTKHDDSIVEEHGKSSIGLMGFWRHLYAPEEILIGRDCDTKVLEDLTIDDTIEVPEELKNVIDGE